MRPQPAGEAGAWFVGQDPSELRLTAVTVAELLLRDRPPAEGSALEAPIGRCSALSRMNIRCER